MKNLILSILLPILIFSYEPCHAKDVEYEYDERGIRSIKHNGIELLTGNGMYIIASCTGADNDESVWSVEASNGILGGGTGTCPGSPFSIVMSAKDDSTLRFQVDIGPAVADYATISLPFDFDKTIFQRFRFEGNQYEVGCAGTWEERTGNSGLYQEIPTYCFIEEDPNKPVGQAKITSAVKWGEIISDNLTVRITFDTPSSHGVFFTNHPGTNNIEFGFGAVKKGESVSIQGEITVISSSEPTKPTDNNDETVKSASKWLEEQTIHFTNKKDIPGMVKKDYPWFFNMTKRV